MSVGSNVKTGAGSVIIKDVPSNVLVAGVPALVKKEMRQLRDLLGADPDSFELMQAALAAATKRVVLKWPLRADAMAGLKAPSHQILGKSTRYDVFMKI